MKNFFKITAAAALALTLTACNISKPDNNAVAPENTPNQQIPTQGDYYSVEGKAQFGVGCPQAGINYTGKIDSFNRIGPACGVITREMFDKAAGHREPWQEGSNPAGWGHNKEVDILMNNGKTYHGWFWNKSHLIANSLGGEASFRNNVAGTRMQNVGAGHGGMAFTEDQARDFLRTHPNGTVTYQVTPKYQGNEVIPRTVTVDIRTSDGSIDEHVVTYNKVAGFSINYVNGTFEKN